MSPRGGIAVREMFPGRQSERFDFETPVNRGGQGNLADVLLDSRIRRAGLTAFVAAEMEFSTAPCILRAYAERVRNGLFGFTVCDEPYLAAVCSWMSHMRGWRIDPEWIVPTYGTIFSLSTAIRAFTQPGDGVVVQVPGYMRYEQAIKRNGRCTINNRLRYADGAYSMDLDDLRKCLADPRNKLLVLCNPHNPVGRVWSPEELADVANLAAEYDVLVFSDEIFAEIVFAGHHTTPFITVAGAHNRAIVATSLGKVFNFTGVNHANIIIADEGLRLRFRTQRDTDHFGSIDPFAYTATIAGYSSEGAAWVRAVVEQIRRNIALVSDALTSHLPSVQLCNPEGTFVAWIDWNGVGLTDEQLDEFLINDAYLQLDPGPKYGDGGSGFTRMNVASTRANVQQALERLVVAARARGF